MAAAQPNTTSKLKLLDPLPSMVLGNKFLKWSEVSLSQK